MPLPAWISHLGRVEYNEAAALQRALRAARALGEMPDVLLVLEHEPVITTGWRTEPQEVALARTMGVPVVPTERGGKATWHGPGQVVVYPIIDLRLQGSDIRSYVRKLEQALIDTLETIGVSSGRREGYPGVFTADGAKIASIGVRVSEWVSMHGIALNINNTLEPFSWFTPCGLPEVSITNVATELADEAPSFDEVVAELVRQLTASLGFMPIEVPRTRLEQVALPHAAKGASTAPDWNWSDREDAEHAHARI